MADKNEVIKQIAAAWETAKAQLDELKAAVERNTQVAQIKLESTFLGRERDVALRDLGEAVYAQVQKGKLQLPPAVSAALKAVQDVEKRLEDQAGEISAILQEGNEVADRLGKGNNAKSVAAKAKKR